MKILIFSEDPYRPVLPGGGYINAVYIDVSVQIKRKVLFKKNSRMVEYELPTCDTYAVLSRQSFFKIPCRYNINEYLLINKQSVVKSFVTFLKAIIHYQTLESNGFDLFAIVLKQTFKSNFDTSLKSIFLNFCCSNKMLDSILMGHFHTFSVNLGVCVMIFKKCMNTLKLS